MKTFFTSLFVALAICLSAQNVGRIVIHNSINQPFIASLNGVRLSNQPVYSVSYDYLDDVRYNVNIYFNNTYMPLRFTVMNKPDFESVYVLTVDQYNKYQLMLQSQTLLSQCLPSNPSYPSYPNYPNNPNTPTQPPYNNGAVLISNQDLQDMVATLKKEISDNTRLDMAKSFLKSAAVTSEQVSSMIKAFSFESTQVEFAKYAYSRTIDKPNYYKIYNNFTFSSSKTAITEFIKNQ